MKYPTKIQKQIKKAHTMNGMSFGECYDDYFGLLAKAETLVKERIGGDRKGLVGEPNYKHSFRVHEIVKKLHHWDDPDFELFLAALLHDVVEDGGVSFEELIEMGFSGRTIQLIYLCTHDKTIKNHTERWILMIARLIEARDDETWFIKLVDLADNLNQSRGLTEENRKFMIETKAPILLRLTEHLGAYSYRYHNYLKTILEQIQNGDPPKNTIKEQKNELMKKAYLSDTDIKNLLNIMIEEQKTSF
jgi:(p)ppGpp synthase/HD superfamily hydrolase